MMAVKYGARSSDLSISSMAGSSMSLQKIIIKCHDLCNVGANRGKVSLRSAIWNDYIPMFIMLSLVGSKNNQSYISASLTLAAVTGD